MTALYEQLPAYEVESPEWHEQRRQGIGASDVAAILGLSPWATPLSIYKQKLGVPNVIDENLAWFGHHLEPVIADWVREKHPEVGVVHDGFSARSLQWPWLTAAPDRLAYVPTTPVGRPAEIPIELKTSSAFSKATWDAGVPLYYAVQVQAQLAVFGAPYGWLAVLHGGNSPMLHGPIERDDEFINDELVPRTRAFWEDHVLRRVPPEPMTTGEAVEIWPGDADADPVVADDETYALFAALRHARLEEKAAKAEAERTALEIQKRMGDATALVRDEQVLVTWKPQAGAKRLDTAALKAEHPEIVAEYTRQGEPSRRFLPKDVAA